MSGCGIYNKYQRPTVQVDSLYRDTYPAKDTTSLAALSWKELFTDTKLQRLIEQGIEYNTDLRSAYLRVTQAEASLRAAKLSYIPSVGFNAQGNTSSFGGQKPTPTYQLALSANWEIDIFGKVTTAKRAAHAAWLQSDAYRQAVQTRLVATIANSYYTLLMLDDQLTTSKQTATNWKENVKTMSAMKSAGMTTEAAVAQAQANSLSVEASILTIEQQINEVENSLSTLLAQSPQVIERGTLSEQRFPGHLSVGVPLQLLSNRPDVRQAEYALSQAFYTTAQARAAFYPSISLGGSAGWMNGATQAIVNPGQLLLSALGSLTQPIFNQGANTARLNIAKAQQEEAKLNFQQSILNAGAEVNDALVQWQTARKQIIINDRQIESLNSAVRSTKLLMKYGKTTYLEVLIAEQYLLQASLTQTSTRFNEIQGVINLYHSLGGGVN